jgi:hypothetical protein
VLDPSCGSGSFLSATIAHFLTHNPDGTDNDRLRLILGNVQGIDIHPVAVTIARATYVLALGKLISAARSQINIPIYLADSLFLPREVEQNLYDKLSGVEVTFGGRKNEKHVVIPDMLIQSPELFDNAISACTKVAEEHASNDKDSKQTLDKYLAVHVPELHKVLEYPDILDSLWSFTESLAGLIREKKNSIWSFIIRNSYRPAMLKQQFDYIIGNPPWLSYRYISDPDYQDEIKRRAVTKYKIAPKSQKLMTQMELATVFLAHSMATFARKDARLAFVMPRGILNSDQHQNLILRKYSTDTKLKLTGYWDLWDVKPLFNVPACVLFAVRYPLTGSAKDVLPVLEWAGTLPARDVNWQVAKTRLHSSEKEGRVIYLGSRAALSTAPGATSPTKASKYLKVFHQGATIVPRTFYFVCVNDLNGKPDNDVTYWAETDPEQAALAKKPYDDISLSGPVEGRFIYSTVLGRHILPFEIANPATVVLPVDEKHGSLGIIKVEKMKAEGYREFAKWMSSAEQLWNTKRGDKADKQDVYEWLDYQGKLSAQNLTQRYLVLYNAEGTNVAAALFDRSTHTLPLIVEHTVYWAALASREEADYLCAVLNSEGVNLAIKPFQAMGLLGERHIQKKLLELPIPTFDHEDPKHVKISELGATARETVALATKSGEFPIDSTVARQRALIRTHLKTEMEEIDRLVIKLLSQ